MTLIFWRWGSCFHESEEGSDVGGELWADTPAHRLQFISCIKQQQRSLCCKCICVCFSVSGGRRQRFQLLSESSFPGLEPKMFSLSVIWPQRAAAPSATESCCFPCQVCVCVAVGVCVTEAGVSLWHLWAPLNLNKTCGIHVEEFKAVDLLLCINVKFDGGVFNSQQSRGGFRLPAGVWSLPASVPTLAAT